ncbi:MAG: Eco57I restriction-modification methylase domain-containing protein [Candidatus Cloacimonetes bacterium]|nr:Eco57I restriction-modification methylase domain-containing protein [Candidatus Cloacimonadota bacterium]
MNTNDLKKEIEKSIQKFSENYNYTNAINLFEVLGYKSDLKVKFDSNSVEEFKDYFITDEANFRIEKTYDDKWKEVTFLFQITQSELNISSELDFFKVNKFNRDEFLSYTFLFIEMQDGNYPRGVLSTITREINKNFLMPVMVLFKIENKLTISIINRRPNKVQKQKDVLEKVTLIKDISIENPHRAHVEILFDLSLHKLIQDYKFTNFLQLHNAWQKVLDTSELNKKFYKELSNWYFWALKNVHFPKLENELQENSNSIALIRMITRIIFIWFMKERELIPNKLFKPDFLKSILKFDDKNESIYYKAILQNLFFATLNQESEKRDFRKPKQNFNATTLYRYEKYFTLNKEEALSLFKDIPFLNGGLFDCLDKPHPTKKGKQGGDEIIRIDGFSDREDSLLKVPDSIFFQEKEKTVDLNEIYGTKNKKYKTRGLLDILKSYKFTVEENTPIEEEIALDPELLGQVFENLLASYNPETQTTARKSTGSYYTPRQIVDYMVDESLKVSLAHLVSQNLEEVTIDDMKTGLEILFAYTEKEHAFNEIEVTEIVKVISELKMLDPACGSGAFPMGILHKLVFILNKLDKENKIWRKLQEERAVRETEEAYKVGNKEERHTRLTEIEEAFNNNTSDYGRKLFLIENCIFGVDIQPIATQISKLRFFISLLVDEKIDKTRPNWNIRPMPNLETKFVAANSLIGIEKTLKKDQFEMFDYETKSKEEELKKIRHKYFSAKTPKTKKKYRDDDKKIRDYIKQLLIDDEWDVQTAEKLADWDPYDQNSHADFFDKEWMFGVESGFDIVIGNPPYMQIQKMKKEEKIGFDKYKTFSKSSDIYCLFYENGFNILKENGVLTFITSNSWMRTKYGKLLRKYFADKTNPLKLLNFEDLQLFQAAIVESNILIGQKNKFANMLQSTAFNKKFVENDTFQDFFEKNHVTIKELDEKEWNVASPDVFELKKKIEKGSLLLKELDIYIARGITTGCNEAFYIDEKTKNYLIKENNENSKIIKPILRGKNLQKYLYEFNRNWVIYSNKGFNLEKNPSIKKHFLKFETQLKNKTGTNKWYEFQASPSKEIKNAFNSPKIIWGELSNKPKFTFDADNYYLNNTVFLMTGENLKYLLVTLNSKLAEWYFIQISTSSGMGTNRWLKYKIEQLPIKIITLANQQPFIKLVDQILIDKKAGKDTQKLEDKIDLMVYKLYELTYEEVLIVDPETTLSKEEYENFKLEVATEIESTSNNQDSLITSDVQKPLPVEPEQTTNVNLKVFSVGQHVLHPTFGEGKVLHVAGSGDTAKITVKFGRETKKLIAGYAKLRGV